MEKTRRNFLLGILLTAGFCILFIIPSMFLVVIDAGQVGVVSTFGSVSDQPIYPGIQVKSPFQNIIIISTRTESYTMSAVTNEGVKTGDDSIEVLAKDGAKVNLDVTVLYRLKPEKTPEIYKTLGLNYTDNLIRPSIRSVIRGVAAKYGVIEIYSTKRDEIINEISKELKNTLEDRGIALEEVLMRDVKLSATLTQSIEQKLAAQQEAEKLDFVLEKEKKEAQRKVIEAQGQRDAQKIISESLTDKYLYFLYIQGLQSIDGEIYVPTEGGVPLFKTK